MAKKKSPEETSAPSAPIRRRAPQKQAAPASAADTANATASVPAGNGNQPEPSQAEIAEAAYFRHLNRQGSGGDEFSDWIEAERELKERHSR